MSASNERQPQALSALPLGREGVELRPAGGRGPAATLRREVARRATSARWQTALPIALIALAYAIPLLIVRPTLDVPLIDDWNYQLSVEHLVEDGELWIAPWTAATLVLQVVWGGLFAAVFGVSPTVLRASTLVASFGGTIACFGIFRELGATRPRALLGALAVWLNPIAFGLSYTFMTDVPYLALMSVTAYVLVRAVRTGGAWELATGSALAGLAFLVRQQGALLPLAAFAWLLWVRPDWFRASPLRSIAALLGPCLLTVQEYFLWRTASGAEAAQGDYVTSLREAGLSGILDLTWRLAVVGIFFVGVFVFPIVLGAARELPAAWRRASFETRGWVVAVGIVAALWTRWQVGERNGYSFPFITWGSMLHEDGLGVLDAEGTRPFLLSREGWLALGILFALSALAALLLVSSRGRASRAVREPNGTPPTESFRASAAGFVAVLGLAQFAGMIPASLYIRHLITFDRYYLPLLPFAIGLVLWAVRDRRFSPSLALVGLLVLGTVNVVGVQDWFAFKRAQWDAAEWLVNDQNVPLKLVDAASQWDGIHFYEYGLAHPEDRARRRPGDVWWLYAIAPAIDPVYVVGATKNPRQGYRLFAQRAYSSWIRPKEESWVYVWRRSAAPPQPATTTRGRTVLGPITNAPTPSPARAARTPTPEARGGPR